MTRSSKHLVDAEVEFTLRSGERHKLYVRDIPYTWDWDYTSREATELWAVMDYIDKEFTNYLDFAVISMSSTKALTDEYGQLYRDKTPI